MPPFAAGQLYSEVCHMHDAPQPAGSTANLVCARMNAGKLWFSSQEERHQAFSNGVFLLHIPDDLDVGAADQFANEFYRGDASLYGGFKALTSASFDDGCWGSIGELIRLSSSCLNAGSGAVTTPSKLRLSANK